MCFFKKEKVGVSIWFAFQADRDVSYFLDLFFICQSYMYCHALFLYTYFSVSFFFYHFSFESQGSYILSHMGADWTNELHFILNLFYLFLQQSPCCSLHKSILYTLTKMETFMLNFSIDHPFFFFLFRMSSVWLDTVWTVTQKMVEIK